MSEPASIGAPGELVGAAGEGHGRVAGPARVLLTTRLPDDEQRVWLDEFAAAMPQEHIVDARDPARRRDDDAAVDIAIVANPAPGALAGLPGLRLIQSLWAGVDGLLADRSLPAEVPLARMIDPAMNEAMAQTALWAVLSLHRDHFAYARQQREACWHMHPQRRADEVVVAVLGLGQMGRAVAQALCRAGYRVLGWSLRPAAVDGVQCSAGPQSLPHVLAQAAIVVNLLPLTAGTRGLFDARTIGLMPLGAALVNLARGGHVVDADLLAALDAGRLGHAVLDVFDAEPLPPDHPYWRHPRVTVLPHVAAQTDPRSAAAVVARNVRALREGLPLTGLVDRARGY